MSRRRSNTRLLAVALALAVVGLVATSAWAATKYPTVFTEFKLKASSSGGKFKGQIDSTKSKCVNGRQVKLFRKHNGDKKKLGSDKTNGKGKFSIDISGKLKDGSYYSKVSKKKYDNGKKGLRGRHLSEDQDLELTTASAGAYGVFS